MKARGSDKISAQILVPESEDANQVDDPALYAAGDVSIARVGAANMRAERTSSAGHIRAVGKLVESYILFPRGFVTCASDAGNRSAACGNQGRAVSNCSSHHGFRQLISRQPPEADCLIQKLPEAADVLPKLTHDHVGAIQAQVLFPRMVGGLL